ncbi:unconventional prefoldin RPB5 interactor 1-like [Actinia tenebrosa]|uniref:Unconventional prefoldin RPB5 interactor 1-like n=1 Tax=Actinia tenebrosa TaxID=6105 RepID=A0A6P8ITP2_ACTTE|nr:unconventional prefoldin RPB5 interactor 1-like [Actinia tenebrosa]
MADKIDTKRLEDHKRNAILELENRLSIWRGFHNDYQSLQETLNFLPQKISHEIMVPFGSLAFMPGKLVHTNEILVLLGDNWFAKRSASQALEIVERRQKYVEENIESLNKELELFSSQLNFTKEFENIYKVDSGMIEIKEEIKDNGKPKGPRIAHEKAKTFAPKKVKQFQRCKVKDMSDEDKELFAKLDRLELNETRNKELENLGTSERFKDSETVKYDTWSLPKRTEVKFADELKLKGSDSDDSDDSNDSDNSSGAETEDQDNIKTIMVNFTNPTSGSVTVNDQACVSPSESESITAPSDIYLHYNPAPKSILKSSSTEKESLGEPLTKPSNSDEFRNEKESDREKAFSGKIIERSADSIPIQMASEPKPKRLSRFKAQRKS